MRILRYIQATVDEKLTFESRTNDPVLEGYADADWASDTAARKSVSGYLVKVYGSSPSWSTKKQTTVALSSAEAEYVAVTQATCEALWIQQILRDLRISFAMPTILYEDNQACIQLAKHLQDQRRMKHVDIKYHFIREKIAVNQVKLVYISMKKQLADFFTKVV